MQKTRLLEIIPKWGAAILTIGILLLPADAPGADITWTNETSGSFSDADNWDGAVPGIDDRAIIELAATVTVDFASDVFTDELQIGDYGAASGDRPHVLFDLSNGGGGHTYSVVGSNDTYKQAVYIGALDSPGNPDEVATLTVVGGTLKAIGVDGTNRIVNICYNAGSGSAGRLVVSGANARVEADLMNLARGGETAYLVLEGGATGVVANVRPGLYGSSGSEARITVRDPGTVLELGRIYRHEHGRVVIVVENGGAIVGSSEWRMGNKELSDVNIVVTGPNSRAETGALRLLSWQSYSNRNATVIVADGGRIDSSSVLNEFSFGTGDYLVTDPDSIWHVSSTFYIAGRAAATPQGDDMLLVVGEGGVCYHRDDVCASCRPALW